MHNDFFERKQKLQRRISYLQQKVQDKKVNHILSSLDNPTYQRGFSADITVKNISKPPLHKKFQQSKIQQLQEMVKVTVERQHVLEQQIVMLKSMLKNKQESKRQYSNYQNNQNIDYRNNRFSIPNKDIEQKQKQQQNNKVYDRSPIQQMINYHNHSLRNSYSRIKQQQYEQKQEQQLKYSEADQSLNSSNSCFSQQNLNQKFSKSLTVTRRQNPIKVSNLYQPQFEYNKSNKSSIRIKVSNRSSKQNSVFKNNKRIIISTGVKKYIASRIIMRRDISNNLTNISKSKSKSIGKSKSKIKQKNRTDTQFLQLMLRRNKVRQTLLKKVYKIKNTKKAK